MNIIIKDIDRPLITKGGVHICCPDTGLFSSDNEDYFQKIHIQRRKRKVFADNDERGIFLLGECWKP